MKFSLIFLLISSSAALTIKEGSSEEYVRIVRDTSRSEGVFILFNTFNPEIKCPICRPFEEKLLATLAGYPGRAGKFIRLDFNKCRDAYILRKLESVPWLEYYPPCKDGVCPAPKTYPVHSKGHDAEALFEFVSDLIGNPPKSMASFYALFATLIISAVFAVKFFDFLYGLACSKWLWAAGSSLISMIMTSGFMWSRIRKPPPFQKTNSGINYFAQGLTYQFGMESQIIFALNLGMFLVGVAIAEVNRRMGKKQKYADCTIFCLVVSFVALFSAQLKFFGAKQPNYPFRLLL